MCHKHSCHRERIEWATHHRKAFCLSVSQGCCMSHNFPFKDNTHAQFLFCLIVLVLRKKRNKTVTLSRPPFYLERKWMDQRLTRQNRYQALGNHGVRSSSYLVLLAILNSAQRLWEVIARINSTFCSAKKCIWVACVRNLDVGDAKRILSKYYGKPTLV